MGVPVIGCQYHMRHGRMAYTFMTQVGLGHLCADSVDTYPDKVREVSQNVELLRELRQNLRDRLTDSALFDTSIFRVAFENAMRDAFVTHCVNNKKPFDTNYYEGEDKILLRDCVRAADIILYEINRQHGKDEERFFELLKEYKRLHRFMLERLSEIFIEDKNSLVIAVKINELMEILTRATNNAAISSSVKAIKALLLKFTVRG
jgi:hypothetical protein